MENGLNWDLGQNHFVPSERHCAAAGLAKSDRIFILSPRGNLRTKGTSPMVISSCRHPSLWYISPRTQNFPPARGLPVLFLSWSSGRASGRARPIVLSPLPSFPSLSPPSHLIIPPNPPSFLLPLFLSSSLIFAYHTRYRSRGDQRGAFVVRSSFGGRENPSRLSRHYSERARQLI